MTFYLYKITNLINNKIYFGKTNNITKRWSKHKYAAKNKSKNDFSYLHRSMLKYDYNNFVIEKLLEFDTEKEVFDAETTFIKKYGSKNSEIGYNLTFGGEGSSGYKHTSENKKKMSILKQGIFNGSSNPFYGLKHSEETKINLSKKQKESHIINKEKYDNLNKLQCKIDTKTCKEIQEKYLTKKYSMQQLSCEYKTTTTSIYKIIHGTYAAIKNETIISLDDFKSIKKEKILINAIKSKKFSEQQIKDIISYYKNCLSLKETAREWKTSTVTLRKIFKSNNIIIERILSSYCKKITEDNKLNIVNKYFKENYSVSELSKLYVVTKCTIYRIIRNYKSI